MVHVTFPDGSVKEYEDGVAPAQVAERIGRRLAAAALAALVDDQPWDLRRPLPGDCRLKILTWSDAEGREVYRHSSTHLMAQAVKALYPEARLTVGPPLEDRFYYDIDMPPVSEEDFPAIEAKMRELAEADFPIVREEVSRDAAHALFDRLGEPYKLEILATIPADEKVTLYRQGDWVDLCRGPHLPSTGRLKAFKLLSVAGAYWRGDSNNKQLQRLYGTSYPTQQELDEHMERLEQAKLRDHRKLGRELGLFYFSEDVGPGLPLFAPKGEMLRHLMEGYVRDVQTRYGYQHVWTGHVVKEQLYKKSGHYEVYRESMFPPMVESDELVFRLKPMNCPSHMSLYKEMGLHSYRDLPMRFAEFATLYRYEDSGTLSGLTRVRALTQDDCHIFCTPEQIEPEFGLALNLIREVLGTYHFTDYKVRLSLRDEGGGKYIADDEAWDMATAALRSALNAHDVSYEEAPGEAAIYGPKADFLAKDVLGREWQLSTIQVDFIQPRRLGLEYVGVDGHTHTPVVLHRAVTGSTERFMGVMIEHFAGVFPVWIAPVQAIIIPISDEKHREYAEQVTAQLRAAGLRVELDLTKERMQAKIRRAQLQKVPYMLIIGDKEQASDAVSVRLRSGEELGGVPLTEFIARVTAEVAARS